MNKLNKLIFSSIIHVYILLFYKANDIPISVAIYPDFQKFQDLSCGTTAQDMKTTDFSWCKNSSSIAKWFVK